MAFKKTVTAYRAVDQQPQYQAERASCAGYGLVAKFSSKITVNPEIKKEENKSQCRELSNDESARDGDVAVSSSDVNPGG